jgi:DNA-binding IclR family transcriptional regulator
MSSVQSVERAFAILQCLAGGPAGVSQVAERAQLPKSTVSRLLSTLSELGVVEQLGAGGDYRIGKRLVDIAAGSVPGANLVAVARPHLTELSARLGEAAGLSVLDGHRVLYLDQVASTNPVMVRDWTGERLHWHVVSSGLVLTAHAPAAVRDEHLAAPLEAFTARSMTDPGALRQRLTRVAADGYAWVRGDFEDGVNSVAAPVHDPRGAVVAAVHAHGPDYRFPPPGRDDEVAALVVEAASRVTARLASRGS